MKRILSLAALAVFAAGCATTGPAPTMTAKPVSALPAELQALAAYQFGDSRVNVIKVENLVSDAARANDDGAAMAADLASLLAADTTYACKDVVCRQLKLIGTEAQAPILGRLLLDVKTADIARYALESIPGAKVDAVLIDALDKAPEAAVPGIVTTLGARKSVKAAPAIEALTESANADIASAASAALARING